MLRFVSRPQIKLVPQEPAGPGGRSQAQAVVERVKPQAASRTVQDQCARYHGHGQHPSFQSAKGPRRYDLMRTPSCPVRKAQAAEIDISSDSRPYM